MRLSGTARPVVRVLTGLWVLSAVLACFLVAAASAHAAPIFPQVQAGLAHACAVKSSGSVVCWGSNKDVTTDVPSGLGSASQLDVGSLHACAVSSEAQAVCWGYDLNGQTDVPGDLGNVTEVTAGGYHSCAIRTDKKPVCWGHNASGQTSVPSQVAAVTSLSAGYMHTCAIGVDHLAVCWGSNADGEASVPPTLGSVTQITAGIGHSCAVTTAGEAVCWGTGTYGETRVPVDLGAIGAVIQISSNYRHTCAVKANLRVACWGLNGAGQSTVPSDLGPVREVTTGFDFTCAVKTNGQVACWGANGAGQITVPQTDLPSLSSAVVNFADGNGLDFVDVRGGERSAMLSVPIRSKSSAPEVSLSITGMRFTNSFNSLDAFSVLAPRCMFLPIADDDYCVLRVRFTPEIWQRGDLNAEFTISDDSPSGSHLVTFTGRAIAPSAFVMKNFDWIPNAPGGSPGRFTWVPSEAAKVTITLTQPVSTVVTVRRGRRTTKKTVTAIKPVTLVSNRQAGIPTSDGIATEYPSFSWSGKVNNKAAAKGTWKATITAVSSSGKATLEQSVKIS